MFKSMSDTTPKKDRVPGAAVERCKLAAIAVGWDHPAFLVPFGKVEKWEETTEIPTMGISMSGRIRVNPDFVDTFKDMKDPAKPSQMISADQQIAGIVFHELFHPMLGHHERLGSRNLKKWNRAADRSLNQALTDMGVQLPPGALMPGPGQVTMTAEEIYEQEPDQPGDDDEGNQPGPAGAGCGIEDDTQGGSGQSPMTQEQAQRMWSEAATQSQALAGLGDAKVMARLFNAPPARTSISQILKSAAAQAIAAHGRDVQSWGKRSNRCPPGIYLPGWKASKPRMAFVFDTSGSVSDAELETCVGFAVSLARQHQSSGLKIFLALHASNCYYHGWISGNSGAEISGKMTDRGGTDFAHAYQVVGEHAGKIDTMVHLTDGECYGAWPAPPPNARKMIAAILPGRGEGHTPPPGVIVVPAKI